MKSHRAKLGQNFLADNAVLKKIVEVADIGSDDIVLEIGPGQGSLTYALCQKAKKVIAVEKDEKLFCYLQEKFSKIKNLELVNADILEFLADRHFLAADLRRQGYKIVANIPYYLTSFLLRTISEMENKPSQMTLMVQKEVAERMCVKKGEMNLLALSVQMFATPEIKFFVGRKSFHPAPKVDSAVVNFTNHKLHKTQTKKNEEIIKLAKQGFRSKRKTLANNLTGYENLTKKEIFAILGDMELSEKIRPQELDLSDWQKLYKEIKIKVWKMT